MQGRIAGLLGSGIDETETGRTLAEEAQQLETVRPVSGGSLAEYALLLANADTAVLDYYRMLCEASEEIAARYRSYQNMAQSGENPVKAPGNVYYYVENPEMGQRFTNLDVRSLVGARAAIGGMEHGKVLFDGERRYNIMVSASDHPDNENAALYFMQSRFTGNSESVLIAYDTTYSAGDELHQSAVLYRQRRPVLIGAAVTGAIAALAILLLFFWSVADIWQETAAVGPSKTHGFDELPTEIACGLILILGLSWWMIGRNIVEWGQYRHGFLYRFGYPVTAAIEYWILLWGVLGLLRRIRDGVLWRNSVIYTVIMSGRQVYSAKRSSERLVFIYVGFVVLNMVFLLIGGLPGAVMALVLNLAALLYLMRDVVGSQSVKEGLDQISKGNLEYRINTQVLMGESRDMGEAVNEMGEGLQKSVAAMLEHERLKSELITNVSHDLKTPLTSIMNYVDLLKREDLPEGKPREYVEILDNKTRRLKQLTEDLIEVSRINSGNVNLEMERLALWDFLKQACGEFEDRFEQRELKLKLQKAPGASGEVNRPAVILADGAQLWRVFENLLGNAAKYAKEGSQIQVRLEEETAGNGDRVWNVLIRNEPERSIHYTAEELEERFVRGDESRSSEGSGLGLSIAKSLTELMGGSFVLEVQEDEFLAEVSFPDADNKK